MFYEIRYQTGEIKEVAEKMRAGRIPCLDVTDIQDFDSFSVNLSDTGLLRMDLPYDKDARDRVKEPEFEFRAAFREGSDKPDQMGNVRLMYLDVYFEPDLDETYDSVCEI